MKSLLFFKGKESDHKVLNFYFYENDEKKEYLMVEFWNTKKSKEVNWIKVWDWTDKEVYRFWIKIDSFYELWWLISFFEDKQDFFGMHKTDNVEKMLNWSEFKTDKDKKSYYFGIVDKKEDVKLWVSLSDWEMKIVSKYLSFWLENSWKRD